MGPRAPRGGGCRQLRPPCNDETVHIYSAQLFNPDGGCVESPVAIDSINGGTTSDCSPVCLVTSVDGQAFIYVSNECPPAPAGYTVEARGDVGGASDPCGAALTAFAAFAADGGVCPLRSKREPEAGLDAGERRG